MRRDAIWDQERLDKAVEELLTYEYRGYCMREDDVRDLLEEIVEEYEGLLDLLLAEQEERDDDDNRD